MIAGTVHSRGFGEMDGVRQRPAVREALELGDNSYRLDEPGINRTATTRLESAEYDFRKAIAARRGEGPPPLVYYLSK